MTDATLSEAQEKEQETGTERKGMNLAEWRQAQIHEVILPSGLMVKAKKASIMDLISGGKIPDNLVAFFEMSMKAQKQGKTAKQVQAELPDVSMEDIPAVGEAFDAVALACIVEPPIGPEPTDDVLGVGELSYDDKAVLFEWANEGVMNLRPFRQQ